MSPGGSGGWTTPDSSSGKATRNARGSGATELVSGAARDRQQKQANANRRSGILKTRCNGFETASLPPQLPPDSPPDPHQHLDELSDDSDTCPPSITAIGTPERSEVLNGVESPLVNELDDVGSIFLYRSDGSVVPTRKHVLTQEV